MSDRVVVVPHEPRVLIQGIVLSLIHSSGRIEQAVQETQALFSIRSEPIKGPPGAYPRDMASVKVNSGAVLRLIGHRDVVSTGTMLFNPNGLLLKARGRNHVANSRAGFILTIPLSGQQSPGRRHLLPVQIRTDIRVVARAVGDDVFAVTPCRVMSRCSHKSLRVRPSRACSISSLRRMESARALNSKSVALN